MLSDSTVVQRLKFQARGLPIVNTAMHCTDNLVRSQFEPLAEDIFMLLPSGGTKTYILVVKFRTTVDIQASSAAIEKIFLSLHVQPVKGMKPKRILYVVRERDLKYKFQFFSRAIFWLSAGGISFAMYMSRLNWIRVC